ncbi:unnamed protein product [Linum trigynum]|uniref:Uncharacterized protein n=1 Tax=Linum trigynum TaxID=586398 RepID=A0AAV2DPQ0_9ROSI
MALLPWRLICFFPGQPGPPTFRPVSTFSLRFKPVDRFFRFERGASRALGTPAAESASPIFTNRRPPFFPSGAAAGEQRPLIGGASSSESSRISRRRRTSAGSRKHLRSTGSSAVRPASIATRDSPAPFPGDGLGQDVLGFSPPPHHPEHHSSMAVVASRGEVEPGDPAGSSAPAANGSREGSGGALSRPETALQPCADGLPASEPAPGQAGRASPPEQSAPFHHGPPAALYKFG